MTDFGLAKNGAEVVTATCMDPERPASNIVEGDESLYWSTTGLYPQEVIIRLGNNIEISRIKTVTSNVRRLVVERCTNDAFQTWEPMYDVNVPAAKDAVHGTPKLQVMPNQIQKKSAKYLKIKIMDGWADFATVHCVSIQGK